MSTSSEEQGMAGEKYAAMARLAEWFRTTGDTVRERADLGRQVLTDPDVADSAELSPDTWRTAEEEVHRATTGRSGLDAHALELDADALVVRATVLTYQWIDDLQEMAQKTLGSIAARALGYLAPEVALGGPIVSAGLIETTAPDRDELAAYLNELAESNPELMQHFVSGGGGLVESLQLRAMLTTSVLAGDARNDVARGGLRATGAGPFADDFSSALRDIAGGYVSDASGTDPLTQPEGDAAAADRPASIAALVQRLTEVEADIFVQPVGAGRFLAFLTGGPAPAGGALQVSDGDLTAAVSGARQAIEKAVSAVDGARLMLVGLGRGGLVATRLAAEVDGSPLPIDQVITAGAPAAQGTEVPVTIPVLALEDRSDPVALLGSLLNATLANRLTVVFDGADAIGAAAYVRGGEMADRATHADVVAAVQRLRELGYLSL
ncbi:hypothetical protein [Nocardioides alcanivorans]|uniref:hypothetical protein n=1 Tax=Nocardioides alcanivorans TaxID=2897352 RepID=UPI001F48DDA1|nr:hypothetical protein [Nocardioides alcanivorans]